MRHAVLLGLFAVALCGGAAAAGNPDLETGLMKAMKFDKASEKRLGSSGKAIQAYMKAGYVNPRPNGRADYTDYYLLNKPASLFGHPLVVIEEEYMTRYAGCCVSKGIGVTVSVAGSLGALKKFAAENRCTVEENIDPGKELRSFGIKNTLPKGKYASLSCRVRDAEQNPG